MIFLNETDEIAERSERGSKSAIAILIASLALVCIISTYWWFS